MADPPARRAHVVVYAALLATLAMMSPPTLTGDGGEYVAYALAFSHGRGPALTARDLDLVRADLARIDPAFEHWDIGSHGHPAGRGRVEFVHFWLYPAIAAPFVWAARVTGADPRTGFTIVNVALLVLGFSVAIRRLWWPSAWLLFAGPIVWWVDKAHPEPFIVSLMVVAFAAWRDRPRAALIAVGLVGAQVPVFVFFLPLLAGAAIAERGGLWRRPAFLAALATASILVSFPPIYYLARFGTPTLLVSASAFRWPPLAEFSTILWDLNVGLAPNWPSFVLAVTAAILTVLAVAPRRLATMDVAIAIAGGGVVMLAALQVGNLMHGGTPGVMRYAIWLTPLAVPFFLAASAMPVWRVAVGVIAAVSVPWSLVDDRPVRLEVSNRPTTIAQWVWQHHPSWSRPLPEAFIKGLKQRELPAWTAACEKVLLIGRGDAQGMWPRPCFPADIPDACRRAGALCYANRRGQAYAFDPVVGDLAGLKYTPEIVWVPAGTAGVRAAMAFADWWSLAPVERSASGHALRGWEHVRVEYVFEGRNRVFLVMTESDQGARIALGVPRGATGLLVDADSGEVLGRPRSDDSPSEVWSVPIPAGRRVLVFALATGP